jgi:hypothetical protein
MISIERDGDHAAVTRNGLVLWRLDRHCNPLTSAITWPAAGVVAIGAGACVQFVHEATERLVKTIELGSGDEGDWFGHFGDDVGDTLFVLGWANITAIDSRLGIKWVSRNVAVDGITGGRCEAGRLYVSAEMDPPGGWVDVELDAETGQEIRRGLAGRAVVE